MARIRTVKPELFKHEDLFEAEISSKLPLRLAFIGLFTCCDREGRFKWRPRRLKLDMLPYDENIDIKEVLEQLVQHGFVKKYEYQGKWYGFIPSWAKHQQINNREIISELPVPPTMKFTTNKENKSVVTVNDCIDSTKATNETQLNNSYNSYQLPHHCQEINNNIIAVVPIQIAAHDKSAVAATTGSSIDTSTASQQDLIQPSPEITNKIHVLEPIQPVTTTTNNFIASDGSKISKSLEANSHPSNQINNVNQLSQPQPELSNNIHHSIYESQITTKENLAVTTTDLVETNTSANNKLDKSQLSQFDPTIKNEISGSLEAMQLTTDAFGLVDTPINNFKAIDPYLTHGSRVPHASIAVNNPSQPCTRGIWNMEYGREYGKEHGREGVWGREGNMAKPQDLNSQILEIFKHWKTIMNHPDAQLDSKRKILIKKALNLGYGVKQLCNAITGCSMTPFNMGINPQGQRYDGLHIILRDADQIDRFIYYYHKPPQPLRDVDQRTQGNINALQRWLNKKMQEEVNNAESRFN